MVVDREQITESGQQAAELPTAFCPPPADRDVHVEVARSAVRMIVDAAEYFSDRTSHLCNNVAEGVKAADSLGAVSRQIRTLSSNTSLEASRLGGNATVAEIARQMRLLSQQVTVLSEHLAACLRAQGLAVGEMSGAIDAVLADATATQAILERGEATRGDGEASLFSIVPGTPEQASTRERPFDDGQ